MTAAPTNRPSGFERFIAELGRPPTHGGLPAPAPPDIPRLLETSTRYGHTILAP